jgi:tetratricopeptide (TPR) repeat protein
MRRAQLFLAPLLIGLVLTTPADAKKKSAEADAGEELVPAIQLQSQILARLPDVAEALDAVEANPQDANAWRVLGMRLVEHAGFKDGIASLKQAVELDDQNVAAWTDLGAAYIRSDKVSSGISALKRALKIEPFAAVAHYNLGVGYMAQGNYDAAFSSFETALLIEPRLASPDENPGALTNPMLAYVQHGAYMRREGAAPALLSGQVPADMLIFGAPVEPVEMPVPEAPPEEPTEK